MNRIIRITAVATAIILAPATVAQAQSSTDAATATSNATVVTAIAITNTGDLDFGKIVSGPTVGTVVMSTAGSRSATGGAQLGNAGSASAAAFSVTGETDATYSITLPASATLSDGATNEMVLDTFTSDPSATGTLAGGSETVNVGGTLNVGADQVSGAYTATFDVTVAYN